MNAQDLLPLLDGVKQNPNGWSARCPAHRDNNASLSVSAGEDGRVLLHCHAGCAPESICAAAGIGLADLFPPVASNGKPRITAEYDYRDESGQLLFQVCRFDPKDFRQRAPDSNVSGGWNWSTKGVRRVLFRLPETLEAKIHGEPIYIAEGEKDVQALVKHGFQATCNPGGAGKWIDEYSESLRDASVIVLPDQDEPGRKHGELVASKLRGTAKRVRVIELPDVGERKVKDAFDFFAAGGTREQLLELIKDAPDWTPSRCAAEATTTTASSSGGQDAVEHVLMPLNVWRPSQFLAYVVPAGNNLLLPAYIALNTLTVLVGQGGLGKSRLTLWLAICQILQRHWCGLETAGEPQKWLVLGDENSVIRIKEDLQKMMAGLTAAEQAKVDEYLRIQAVLDPEDADLNLADATTQARIIATIEQEQPGAIIADPLANFAPGDISKPHEMKQAVRLLTSTVRQGAPNAAVIILHHARTGRQNIAQGVGFDAANFASGGKTLYAMARCQLNLMPGRKDDDTRLVLSCAKSNNCARFETRGLIFDPQTFTYSTDPDFDADAWLAEVEGRAHSGQSLCTVADVVSAVQSGYTQTKGLVEHLMDAYATSKRTAERLIGKAVNANAISPRGRGSYMLGRKCESYLTAGYSR